MVLFSELGLVYSNFREGHVSSLSSDLCVTLAYSRFSLIDLLEELIERKFKKGGAIGSSLRINRRLFKLKVLLKRNY